MSISVLANKAYTYKINMGKNLDEFSRFKRITSLCDTAAAFFAKAYYSCNTAGWLKETKCPCLQSNLRHAHKIEFIVMSLFIILYGAHISISRRLLNPKLYHCWPVELRLQWAVCFQFSCNDISLFSSFIYSFSNSLTLSHKLCPIFQSIERSVSKISENTTN